MAGIVWLRPGDCVIDFSFQPPSMSATKAAGYSGIIGYLPWNPDAYETGCLNHSMIQACYDNGLVWGSVWELNADRALGGWAAGVADGNSAGSSHRGLGGAPGSVISCAVDFDANVNTQPAVLDYVAAFTEVVSGYGFAPMAYGSVRVIDRVMAGKLASYGWQAEAWSYGMESSYAHILQRIEGKRLPGTDHCDIYKPLPFTGAEGVGSIMAFSDDVAQQSFTDKVIIGLLTAPHPSTGHAPTLADLLETGRNAAGLVEALQAQVGQLAAATQQTQAQMAELVDAVRALGGGQPQEPGATAGDLARELIEQLLNVNLPRVGLSIAPPPPPPPPAKTEAELAAEAVAAVGGGGWRPHRALTFGPAYPYSGSPHRPFTPA